MNEQDFYQLVKETVADYANAHLDKADVILGLLLMGGGPSAGIEMHVKIDQTGHQIAAVQADDLAIGRKESAGGQNIHDPALIDDDSVSLLLRHVLLAV